MITIELPQLERLALKLVLSVPLLKMLMLEIVATGFSRLHPSCAHRLSCDFQSSS
jgi:hypothetical protein